MQGLDAGDIHERHTAQADDESARVGMRLQERTLEVLDCAEEHRPGDIVGGDAGRQLGETVLRQFSAEFLGIDGLRVDRLRHSAQEVQDGKDHACGYRHHRGRSTAISVSACTMPLSGPGTRVSQLMRGA